MSRALGRITTALATFSAWLLFIIGAMLTYEVVARYFFNSPTIWAEELSRVLLIWAVFLASAGLLASRDHIRVTVLVERFPPALQRFANVVSLVFVAVIAGFVAWNGVPIALGSLEVGRTTGTMLDIPSWWLQASIPVGFALIAAQALLQAIEVAVRPEDRQ
ncbi:MAG: TRAP transporter small permease, partial [Pseudomonadota bacterium]